MLRAWLMWERWRSADNWIIAREIISCRLIATEALKVSAKFCPVLMLATCAVWFQHCKVSLLWHVLCVFGLILIMRELEPNHVQMPYEHIAYAGFFLSCLEACLHIRTWRWFRYTINLVLRSLLDFSRKGFGHETSIQVYNIHNQCETHSNDLWF